MLILSIGGSSSVGYSGTIKVVTHENIYKIKKNFHLFNREGLFIGKQLKHVFSGSLYLSLSEPYTMQKTGIFAMNIKRVLTQYKFIKILSASWSQ